MSATSVILFIYQITVHGNWLSFQNAPKDKILIYDIKDGWEPLCKFLGIEVPDKPFPHENKGGEVIKLFLKTNPVMQRIFTETIISVCFLLLSGVLLSIFAYKLL